MEFDPWGQFVFRRVMAIPAGERGGPESISEEGEEVEALGFAKGEGEGGGGPGDIGLEAAGSAKDAGGGFFEDLPKKAVPTS